MASDNEKHVNRNRAILTQLLRGLPPIEREMHLATHAADLQRSIDSVLAEIAALPPPAPEPVKRRGGRPKKRAEAPKHAENYRPEPDHVHNAGCDHVQAAVERADNASVPGVVRAVLASEKQGLSTRQIIEGVNVLRPGTPEPAISGALHAMRKRGELAREGFHKNYKYRLVPNFTFGIDTYPAPGGETH